MDHSGDILRLCEELKLAKGELSSQAERMKGLETQLEQERMARESAEFRASRLESSERTEAPVAKIDEENNDSPKATIEGSTSSPPDLQTQLERLQATMDEMKQQMESYRMRAENAEMERDEAQSTLAEMVEQKRAENAALEARSASRSRRSSSPKNISSTRSRSKQNGHAVSPSLSSPRSPTGVALLEKAGLEEGQVITADQARILQQFLDQEVLGLSSTITGGKSGTANVSAHDNALTYHGRPLTGAALVVVLGVCLMGWMNNWPRVDR
jgi:hypothetical protein